MQIQKPKTEPKVSLISLSSAAQKQNFKIPPTQLKIQKRTLLLRHRRRLHFQKAKKVSLNILFSLFNQRVRPCPAKFHTHNAIVYHFVSQNANRMNTNSKFAFRHYKSLVKPQYINAKIKQMPKDSFAWPRALGANQPPSHTHSHSHTHTHTHFRKHTHTRRGMLTHTLTHQTLTPLWQ